jgi:hypothetical protein
MNRSIRALVATAALATASPAPSTSAAPSGGAAASASPSTGPVASPTPVPSVDAHGASDLEALLPDEIGGVTLSKVSLTGADFLKLGDEAGQSQMSTFLAELGRTADHLTVAEAYDPAGILVFKEGLFRVAEADPVKLLDLWVASQQAATSNRLQVSNSTVAGRPLTRLTDPTREVGGSTYAFAEGDTLVLIAADDTALLEEALGKIG